jgi:hypothetical protein
LSSAKIVKGNSRKIVLAFAGLMLGLPAAIPVTIAASTAAVSPAAVSAGPVSAGPVSTAPVSTAAAPPRVTLTSYAAARYHARPRGPRRIARSMLARFGWGHRQFRFLNWLWSHESGWDRRAANPYSGAYGIPQAVPGSKMGRGWRWSARTQIRWGMRYIRDRYGSPRHAWLHEYLSGWY